MHLTVGPLDSAVADPTLAAMSSSTALTPRAAVLLVAFFLVCFCLPSHLSASNGRPARERPFRGQPHKPPSDFDFDSLLDPADEQNRLPSIIPQAPLLYAHIPAHSPSDSSASAPLHALTALGVDGQTALVKDQWVTGEIPGGSDPFLFFTYRPSALNVPIYILGKPGWCGLYECYIVVLIGPGPYTRWDNATWAELLPYPTRIGGDNSAWGLQTCEDRNIPLADCVYYISLVNDDGYYTNLPSPFTLIVSEAPVGVDELVSGVSQSSTLPASGAAYSFLTNGQLRDVLIFALTVHWGDADLYISTTNRQPGPSSYDWRSTDTGDDLVIVNATMKSVNGHPPLYYFIGVHNKLTSNASRYDLIGSAYTSSPSTNTAWYLSFDYPQRDYAMANTYRYYYAYVSGVMSGLTITLQSLRGNADLLVNVAPYSSESSVWPSLSRYQFNSTTAGLDQVNITRPTSGMYLYIAVYSRTVDSSYSIVIQATGRITTLGTAGTAATGQLNRGGVMDYAVVLSSVYTQEALYSYLLGVTLKTTSGNADLYISDTFMYPNASNANWTSELAGDGLDVRTLKGDVSTRYGPELHPGTYYIAVIAASDNTEYSLYAVFRPRSLLAANSALYIFQYTALQYYEVDAPRGLAWDVNATVYSPQAYGGYFSLYLSNAVEPNPSIAASFQYSARQVATTQILRVSAAQSTCPGTAALCRFYLAVERVPDATGITYAPLLLITNSTQSPPPQLLPGVPQEKAPLPTIAILSSTGVAGTVFAFNVSCSRAHVTLTLITYTQLYLGASPLLVNRGPLPPLTTMNNVFFGYSETSSVSNRFFTLHFDWTQPAVRGQSMAGQWLVNVAPVYLTGWTLLINITNGDCSPVPAEQSMAIVFTPYAGTVSGASSTLFSYATTTTLTTPLFFTVTPAGNASSSIASSLQLLVRNDGLTPTATSSQFSSNASGVVQVPGNACSTVPQVGTRCLYTLAVRSSAATPTPFLITASNAGQGMPALDAGSAASRLSGSVARSAQTSFTALVPAGRTLGPMSVVVEACVGSVSLLLNTRSGVGTFLPPLPPTNVTAQLRLANVTLPTLLTVPGTANLSSHLIGAVLGLGSAMNAFELRVMADVTWADACPIVADPLPKLTAPASVTTGNIKVRLPLATAPRAITSGMVRQPAGSTLQLRYSVFVLDRANTSAGGVQLRTRCGAQRAALVYSGTGLTASSNTVEFKAPKPTARYQLVVLVEAVWRWTAGGRDGGRAGHCGLHAVHAAGRRAAGQLHAGAGGRQQHGHGGAAACHQLGVGHERLDDRRHRGGAAGGGGGAGLAAVEAAADAEGNGGGSGHAVRADGRTADRRPVVAAGRHVRAADERGSVVGAVCADDGGGDSGEGDVRM